MRLLAIIEAYTVTGPAKNLLEFASFAKEVDLTIASFVRGASSNLFIDTARGAGIKVEVIPERGLFDRNVLSSLKETVARCKPDLIQTHAVKSHFLSRVAGLPTIAPWIAFHHGYTWPAFRARVYNQLDRWSLRGARKVITMSRPFREEIVSRGVPADRIEIVHNAIRADWGATSRARGAELRASLEIAPHRRVILIVGRLSREKDHITLLRAMKRLPVEMNPHLVIVGEGPERPHIEAEIERLDLRDRTTLTGQVKSAEPYYGVADVAVLSSISEGSPNALLEAMAAGVPVVATEVGGIPEIVTDGESALLVRVGEIDRMTDSIANLIGGDPALADRLTERGKALIRERHTPDARVQRLLEIYRPLARAGGSR